MTLGLITGIVGAAAGTAIGAAGAALNLGAHVIQTALNIADPICVELGNMAVAQHCKIAGPHFRFQKVIKGTVTVGPEGKTYCLFIECEVEIGGSWFVKTHEVTLLVPWFGLPRLQAFHSIETC